MPKKAYNVERTSSRVLTVRFDKISAGWEQWFYLSSDHHYDNRNTDLKLLKLHHDKAVERNAIMLQFGDTFCAMQGKYDPRKSVRDARPEHMVDDNYLDLISADAVKFYGQYAQNILALSKGNHETSIIDRCGVDLINRLAYGLNVEHGGAVEVMPYSGYVRFLFTMNKTRRTSRKLYFHHGAGGSAPVTKGTIQTNRQAVYLPDADIVVNGHDHNAWYMPIARERVSNQGVLSQDLLHFVRTPSYKREYGADGWHDRRWGPPKPVGCVWLRFYLEGDDIHMEFTPEVG